MMNEQKYDTVSNRKVRRQKNLRTSIMVWGILGTITLMCLGPIFYLVIYRNWIRRATSQQNDRSNLRGIYQGMLSYSLEYDQWPDTPGRLITTDHLPVGIFIDKDHDDYWQKRDSASKACVWEEDQEAWLGRVDQWLVDHQDYTIHWGRIRQSIQDNLVIQQHGQSMVVGFEKQGKSDGLAVLFADGHAAWVKRADWAQVLAESEGLWKKFEDSREEGWAGDE